jgi:hypothetical protein
VAPMSSLRKPMSCTSMLLAGPNLVGMASHGVQRIYFP